MNDSSPSVKDVVISKIIEKEGGYVNDPDDSGGETNYGITKQVAMMNGYRGDMKEMPVQVAYDIYVERYWNVNKLDAIEMIAPSIAAEMADTGVNCGPGYAARSLQRCLNAFNNREEYYADINVDSSIGPATIGALTAFIAKRGDEGIKILNRAMNCLQGARYIKIVESREKDEKFLYGWMSHRVHL